MYLLTLSMPSNFQTKKDTLRGSIWMAVLISRRPFSNFIHPGNDVFSRYNLFRRLVAIGAVISVSAILRLPAEKFVA